MDIRNAVQVKQQIGMLVEKHGPISGLVNNAGGQFPSPAENISDNGWRAVIDLNLNGTWNVIKAVQGTRAANQKNPLSIVTVTADVRNGKLMMAHTAAARAGVENLTKTLAQEWGSQGIRINCVAPGTILGNGMNHYADVFREEVVRTHHMNPIGRLGTEAEVSAAIVFLLSPASAFITGTTLQVTGGAHLRSGADDAVVNYSEDITIPPFFGFKTVVQKDSEGDAKSAYFASGKAPEGFEKLGGGLSLPLELACLAIADEFDSPGGLVILKHKSWHVYNQKNIDKVRKDEEKARAEEGEKRGRAVKADQEYRLQVLRAKAGSSSQKRRLGEEAGANGSEIQSAGTEGVHLNLFGDLESGKSKRRDGTNEEHEGEKAAEKAKFDKQITMYLGQEVGKDGAPVVPWYAKETSGVEKLGVKRLKTERLEDPAAKFISAEATTDPPHRRRDSPIKKSHKKESKSSRKHSHHRSKSSDVAPKGKSMDELRAERIEREQRERKRAEEVVRPAGGDVSERSRGYNSAFNPEFARHRRG
ncbi:hypothetical protein HDU98_007752 [Podochytrium sp. JEL0797]|nr:hypothetical protein HDU98_007752 [Podochytrium sp. JEL0797]